jgi:hypothetical protein
MVGLTLKQRSSIFLFKLVAAYIYVLLSFDVEINACVATSAAASPPILLSLFNPEKTSRLSKAIKIVEDIKSERTPIGTVGSILSGLEINTNNQVEVNSTDMGNAVGYLVAGTFFVATLVQTVLHNWDSNPANAFLSGLAGSIVPKLFERAEVDEDNRRSEQDYSANLKDYNGNLIARQCEERCLNFNRKNPAFVENEIFNFRKTPEYFENEIINLEIKKR